MGFGAYLADRLAPLAVGAAALAFSALVMVVYGLDSAAVAFVCAVLVLAAAVSLVLDWLHRRAFYQRLEDMLSSLDEAYLATELIERPSFPEGQLFYDALDRESRAMRDRIAASLEVFGNICGDVFVIFDQQQLHPVHCKPINRVVRIC